MTDEVKQVEAECVGNAEHVANELVDRELLDVVDPRSGSTRWVKATAW